MNERIKSATAKVIGTPQQGLAGATFGFFIGFAAVALFGPTATKIDDAMGLTGAQLGFLVAMPALSGSLLRIPFSAWVDTTGGRKPFKILLGLSIIGMIGLTILMAATYDPDHMSKSLYPLLLGLGLLAGCGIATFSVGISQVSYWFPQDRQGSALGTYAGIGNLAPGAFSFLIPVALSGFGVAGSYLAWTIFLVAGTIIYLAIGKNAPFFQLREQGASIEDAKSIAGEQYGQELFPAKRLIDSLKISAANWKNWALVFLYFTTFGGFIALTVWLPTYWEDFFDASTREAGALTATFVITGSVTRIFGGRISDAIGGEKTAIGSLAVVLVGAFVVVISRSYGLSIVGELIIGIGMGVGNAAVFKLVPKEVPEAVGGAAGWVGGLGAFGGFAIPPIMGAIVDSYEEGVTTGYATGFVVIIVLALASMTVAYVLKRTDQRIEPATAPK